MADTFKPLSDKQLAILDRYGYDTNTIGDEEGKKIIDAIAANGWKALPDGPLADADVQQAPKTFDPNGPATAKQKVVLAKYDYDTDDVTFAEASEIIDALKANGWKKLSGLEV